MDPAAHGEPDELATPLEILRRSIARDRVHSAYLLTGAGAEPTRTGETFVRALVCETQAGEVCERCLACRRSRPGEEEIVLDGKGRSGPTYRHVGDHSDLLWVERGTSDTRITIGQIRDLQAALRLRSTEGGRRACVIDGADWMNTQAQNALLRLLEEPPPRTSLVLVAERASAILPTIRSRSVRIRFPVVRDPDLRDPDAPESVARIVALLDGLPATSVGSLLDAAETYRGARATAAEAVTELVDVATRWLVEDVKQRVSRGETPRTRTLDAFRGMQQIRRDLVQRNANPQMMAERLLLGLRDTLA